MSLRWFHMVFLLFVIVGADLFGAWAIWYHHAYGAPLVFLLAVVSFAGGLGLAAYVFWLVRRFDKAGIR